ncbi:MAG: glycine zipper 2TM domain-containing protein [Porphyrobacter sp. IPPAS B-1204]|nr:MAG: glycine zipper 2TM domain-containing protein [Porphyrobacter sp. IPPAS B-1204]
MKHLALLAAAGSMAFFAVPAQAAELPVAPASASTIFTGFSPAASPVSTVAEYDRDRWDDRRRYRGRDDRRWRDNRRHQARDDRRYWQDRDGRWRCRRSDGTTGLVVGAVGGALLGRTIDTRGDRSLGTVLGGVAGGLLGREIDRGGARCR